MVKRFLIIGLILLILLSMIGFAQEDIPEPTLYEDVEEEVVSEDVILDEVIEDLEAELKAQISLEEEAREKIEEPPLFEPESKEVFSPEEIAGDLPEEEISFEEETFLPGAIVGPAVGLMVVYVIMVIVIIAIMIAAFVFWIWMLVDCVKRDFKNDNEKIVWILIIVLVGIIGAIIYHFVVRKSPKKHRR